LKVQPYGGPSESGESNSTKVGEHSKRINRNSKTLCIFIILLLFLQHHTCTLIGGTILQQDIGIVSVLHNQSMLVIALLAIIYSTFYPAKLWWL
jgi:hypothetical protein